TSSAFALPVLPEPKRVASLASYSSSPEPSSPPIPISSSSSFSSSSSSQTSPPWRNLSGSASRHVSSVAEGVTCSTCFSLAYFFINVHRRRRRARTTWFPVPQPRLCPILVLLVEATAKSIPALARSGRRETMWSAQARTQRTPRQGG